MANVVFASEVARRQQGGFAHPGYLHTDKMIEALPDEWLTLVEIAQHLQRAGLWRAGINDLTTLAGVLDGAKIRGLLEYRSNPDGHGAVQARRSSAPPLTLIDENARRRWAGRTWLTKADGTTVPFGWSPEEFEAKPEEPPTKKRRWSKADRAARKAVK